MSDFDQTLSFNDSGIVLSEMLNIGAFEERIAGLSNIHLVQQGGELAYLILHDPEYRRVRKHHLVGPGTGTWDLGQYPQTPSPSRTCDWGASALVLKPRIESAREGVAVRAYWFSSVA